MIVNHVLRSHVQRPACTALFALLLLLPVSATGQFVWHLSDANPVLHYMSSGVNDPSGYTHLLEPSVLFDSTSGEYTMWFTSGTSLYGSTFCISTARSPDGINWYMYLNNPVLVPGGAGRFDGTSLNCGRVIRAGDSYKMYYTGWNDSSHAIGGASSRDGLTWERMSTDPLLSRGAMGAWDSKDIGWCEVLESNGTYYMWYNGTLTGHWDGIGLATSLDGRTWTKYAGNPVFVPGAQGWDSYSVATPAVVRVGGKFVMIYQGAGGSGPVSFGVAYSDDGITWKRQLASPVMGTSATWDTDLGTADLEFHDDTFRMWYSGRSGSTLHWQIGYAWSSNIPLDVTPGAPGLPAVTQLDQNYPNPFNPSTRLQLRIARRAWATVKVFDAIGREVATLMNEVKEPGTYALEFNGSGSPSGVYFCRLQVRPSDVVPGDDARGGAESFTMTRKLLLLR